MPVNTPLENNFGWKASDFNLKSVDDENYREARALYREVLPIIRLVAGHRYVSGSKAALSLIGHSVGAPRPPRLQLPEAEMSEVRDALTSVGLLVQTVG